MDCALVAAAPVLPAGYVVSASRIADRRIILAGYRLADLLKKFGQSLGELPPKERGQSIIKYFDFQQPSQLENILSEKRVIE
jgi:hypothetical protein